MTLKPRPEGYPIKLVRDNTAALINSTGEPGDLWYGETPEEDRLVWLKKKLVEEVAEYVVDGGAHELSDIYGVVMALGEHEDADLPALLATDARGGFADAVMMYGRHEEFDVGPVPR